MKQIWKQDYSIRRNLELLDWWKHGYTYEEIGKDYLLSPNTVRAIINSFQPLRKRLDNLSRNGAK